jgi:hypothetical protein
MPQSKPWHFWLVLLACAAVTILSCWAGWVFLMQPTGAAVKTAGTLRDTVLAETGISPRILANAGALFSQSAEGDQKTILEKTYPLTETLEGIGPVEATATFRAGFFPREKFEIRVDRGGRTATATLPQMRILDLAIDAPALAALPGPARERAERLLRRAAKSRFTKNTTSEARALFFKKVQTAGLAAGCEVSEAQ